MSPCSLVALLLADRSLSLASCGPVSDSRTRDVDLLPPQVQSVQSLGPGEISISFDEDAGLCAEKTRIDPPLAVADVTGAVEERHPPRRAAVARAAVLAGSGGAGCARELGLVRRASSTATTAGCRRLLINELTPRGSGNHPDLVELKALTAGNMGGVVLYLGTPGQLDARLRLSSVRGDGGELHRGAPASPPGDPGEVDETADTAASKGFDASQAAFDFWMRDGSGLGGNNGVLSVCDRPGGACLDGVLYSNRTAQSDELYGGFGSEEMRARAEELVQPAAPGSLPVPGSRRRTR